MAIIRRPASHRKCSTGMEAVDKEDAILELAIEYVLTNGYPPSLSKDRKHAVYMYNIFFFLSMF